MHYNVCHMIKIFYWNDIQTFLNTGKMDPFFEKGTGISIGCFDGLHLGHRMLLKELVKQCKKENLLAGVFSFKRPLPAIKHADDYQGDITTLNQRIKLFEELGIDFVVVVDFDESFSSILGADFLNILLNACNMELIAEGIDFRCGFKGATDTQAIKYWAEQNNVKYYFVDAVYHKAADGSEERVSSSYIRQMIQKGFFTTVNELLERPYELDLEQIRSDMIAGKEKGTQVIPPDGIYQTLSEFDEPVRLEIKNGRILNISLCNSVRFE